MIDAMAQKPLTVLTVGPAGPFLTLPLSQLEDLRRHLDNQGIRYSVQEHVLSVNGGPEAAFVNFGRTESAAAIQSILDQIR